MKTFFLWTFSVFLGLWTLIAVARTILAFQGTLDPLDTATDVALHWLVVALTTNCTFQAFLDKANPLR